MTDRRWFGALVLAAFLASGAAGAAAWFLANEGVSVRVSDADVDARRAAEFELRASIASIREDVSALSRSLERNLTMLVEEQDRARDADRAADLAAAADAKAERAALAAAVEALEHRLDRHSVRPAQRTDDVAARPLPPGGADLVVGPTSVAAPTDGAETPPAEPAPPARARSFLSFRLPSDSFDADAVSTWEPIPELSRVGFDGSSTIHDFSGVTQAVSGAFRASPAHPDLALTGSIRVDLTALDTGDDARDEAMYEHLEVREHPTAVFDVTGFRADEGRSDAGEIDGTMTIHGVAHAFTMPVRWSLDDAHRLLVEGEAPFLLSDYGVEVPSKLGMIKVADEMRLWIALRARWVPEERP